MTDPMTPTPDLAALVEEVLADEGWCCDPYGHEGGPPAVGECSECDRMRGDTAAALVSRLGPALDGVRAEALRDAAAFLVENGPRYNMELRLDGTEDPLAAAYVDGHRDAYGLLIARADAAARPETTEGE